jgi:hypothetical protein
MNPSKINVLVNCEESGTVREEFRKLVSMLGRATLFQAGYPEIIFKWMQ